MKNIWKIIVIVFFLLAIFVIASSGNQKDEMVINDRNTDNKKEFNVLVKERFDEILESSPELESITCEGDCRSVAYFNYSAVPDDLEFIIRSNVATYSNFKLKETGTSHVSIFARFNGKTLLQCDGSKGVVDSCN